ncbi:MAG: hypothetical protein K0U86_18955 [Planctomycetes bacterium]|nr:hypothetical protein [Planctomycetota bacterium]MCH9726988.1 hypothetical protein [Planctomycetota bacterium]MCH9775222.1 hypothetical protein [Planctomycetota bacterium]MCH9791167.1 hypothetical protein [Planctomycetota bacterium]
MQSITAKTRARIYGTSQAWRLSFQADQTEVFKECEVSLEIQGDRRNGYHLVMSPSGFFTADSWHETRQDALEKANELFGIKFEEWSK